VEDRSIHQNAPVDQASDVPGRDLLRQILLKSLLLGCLVYLAEALAFSLWLQGNSNAGAVLFLTFSAWALWCIGLGVVLHFKRKWCEWQGRSTPPLQPPVIKRIRWYEWIGLWFLLVGLIIGEAISGSLTLTVLAASFSWILIEGGLRPFDEPPARAAQLARELRFPVVALTRGLPWIVALLCLRIASPYADPWLARVPIGSPARLMLALGVLCVVFYGVRKVRRPLSARDHLRLEHLRVSGLMRLSWVAWRVGVTAASAWLVTSYPFGAVLLLTDPVFPLYHAMVVTLSTIEVCACALCAAVVLGCRVLDRRGSRRV